jgi:HAD superfamily hydrolase (TIGR01493 family)
VQVRAVLFDYSGTLFRLEEDDSWFEGMRVDEREVDVHVQAELMRRMTAPTGVFTEITAGSDVAAEAAPEAYHAWVHRESGVAHDQAEALYGLLIDPMNWTPYPDTADVLARLHRAGIKTAVVSNIAFDVRPAFQSIGAAEFVDEFVLSFEVGAVKPDPAIFQTALTKLGVAADDAVMVGDSEEADGGARALGCGFLLVDPLPTAQRPDGLRTALTGYGVALDTQ